MGKGHRLPRAVLVTMGCSKNLVDSERLGSALLRAGWEVRYDQEPAQGETVILNTCGFIGDAKEESIAYLLRLEAMRREGLVGRVLVMGCLSERYGADLRGEFPWVDGWAGVHDATALLPLLGVEQGLYEGPREASTPRHYAFLKVAEGCNRGCAFCAIPGIRGGYSSRPLESLLAEARGLVQRGAKELILIAQELTSYGVDLGLKEGLTRLLEGLDSVPGLRWVRLHYAYPTGFSESTLEWIATSPLACRYLDIPLQHVSTPVLRAMRRQHDGEATRALVARLRERIPDIALRTTMMVGYPGEGEREFEELLCFVEEAQFDHLGVFCYSEEEGTPAHSHLSDSVPKEVKEERAGRLMELQATVSLRRKQRHVGQRLEVLVDGRLDAVQAVGRTRYDSPEVDGEVIIADQGRLQEGDLVTARIVAASEYDLTAELEESPE